MSHQTKQETDKLKECILLDIKKKKEIKKRDKTISKTREPKSSQNGKTETYNKYEKVKKMA